MVTLIIFGCNKNNDDGTSNPDDRLRQGEFEFFISGKINGEVFSCGFDLDATMSDYLPSIGGSLFQDLQNNHCEYSYDGGIVPNLDNTLPSGYITFHRYFTGECGTDDELSVFIDLFQTGPAPFTIDDSTKGVIFRFSEGLNGNYYSSIYGSQSGSSFTVTSSAQDNQTIGTQTLSRQIISGTFSCTVYNEDNPSDSISVTEGIYKIYVEAHKDRRNCFVAKLNTNSRRKC